MNRRFSRLLAFFVAFAVTFTFMPVMTGDAESFAASSGKPGKVKSLSATLQTSDSAMLKWSSAGKKVSGYAVYRDGKIIKRVGSKDRKYTDTGLTKGATYKYYVKAYNTYKVRKWYNRKTGRWQTKKPAAKYRGKSKKVKAYKYGARSPERTVTLAADAKADEPAGPASGTVGDFTYTTGADGNITLTSYSGKDEEPVIPGEVNGRKVTAIGDSCFRGNAHILTLTLPDSVTAIEDFAFEACSLIKTVNFSSSLMTIGSGAFSGCAQIEELEIPDSVESIGMGAFLYCQKLRQAAMPANLTYMGKFAFAGCEAMLTVTFRGTKLEELPDRAFCNDAKLKTIELPEGLKSIGKRAFFNCVKLELVNMPRSLEYVGDYAFENTELKETLIFPGSGRIEFGSRVFYNPRGIRSPETGFDIIFLGTPYFREDTFFGSVVSKLTLRKESEGCHLYNDMLYSEDGKLIFIFNPNGQKTIRLDYRPDGTNELKAIGPYVFKDLALDKLVIPSSVTSIDETAFLDNRIGEVIMEDESGAVVTGNDMVTIASGAVCTKDDTGNETLLRYIRPAETRYDKTFTFIIPDSVNTIAPYAFHRVGPMVVRISENSKLTLIRDYAFTGSLIQLGEADPTSYIGSFIIPESLKEQVVISENAFKGNFNSGSSVVVSASTGKTAQKEAQKQAEPEESDYQSLAGDKSLFDKEKFAGYKNIQESFKEWCIGYMDLNKGRNLGTASMPYTLLYKGEDHYREMTCALNNERSKLEHAIKYAGDDFREMYLMMDHGLFAELARAEAPEGDIILFSGISQDKVAMFAGWPMDKWNTFEGIGSDLTDELIAAIGTEVTDPAITSTTAELGTAVMFSSSSETLIMIYASKEALDKLGQVCIEALWLADKGDYFSEGEQEILLNANARYRVLDVGTLNVDGFGVNARTCIKLEML